MSDKKRWNYCLWRVRKYLNHAAKEVELLLKAGKITISEHAHAQRHIWPFDVFLLILVILSQPHGLQRWKHTDREI